MTTHHSCWAVQEAVYAYLSADTPLTDALADGAAGLQAGVVT